MQGLNGFAKWAGVMLIGLGVLFSAGYAIKINSSNIQDLEEIKIKTRIVTLETNYKNIEKSLSRIEKKLRIW